MIALVFSRLLPGMLLLEAAGIDADDLAGLQERQVQRNLRDARREADDQKTSAPRHRTQRRLRIVAADRIVDDIKTLFARDALEQVGERPLAGAIERAARIDDAFVRAGLLRGVDLRLRGRGGDHMRAERLAEFDRGDADAAGGAQHQQPLARLDVRRDPSAPCRMCCTSTRTRTRPRTTCRPEWATAGRRERRSSPPCRRDRSRRTPCRRP